MIIIIVVHRHGICLNRFFEAEKDPDDAPLM